MTTPGKYWTASWNPIIGCGGCSSAGPHGERCWAARMAATRLKHRMPGIAEMIIQLPRADEWVGDTPLKCLRPRWTGEVRFREEVLNAPLQWRNPRVIATNWMGDMFLEKVPDRWISRVFCRMATSMRHEFLLLTKRPARLAEFLIRTGQSDYPLSHIWLGTSCENQAMLDKRLPELFKCGAGWRYWVSLEPCLGRMDLQGGCRAWLGPDALVPERVRLRNADAWPGLNWVVLGAETGPGARPMELGWARSARDQCGAAGVPYYLKSLGPGKGRMLDGRTHDEAPWR